MSIIFLCIYIYDRTYEFLPVEWEIITLILSLIIVPFLWNIFYLVLFVIYNSLFITKQLFILKMLTLVFYWTYLLLMFFMIWFYIKLRF